MQLVIRFWGIAFDRHLTLTDTQEREVLRSHCEHGYYGGGKSYLAVRSSITVVTERCGWRLKDIPFDEEQRRHLHQLVQDLGITDNDEEGWWTVVQI
jgi:hypothetical protein